MLNLNNLGSLLEKYAKMVEIQISYLESYLTVDNPLLAEKYDLK